MPLSRRSAVPADRQDERLIATSGIAGWLSDVWLRIRSGDLGSLPVVIGLILIWAVFQSLNSKFLSSENLVNLTIQMVPIGVMSLGIVLVLLLGEIDLSVGSMSGLSAAIMAVTFSNKEWPLLLAIVAALASGLVVGVVYGLLYNRFGVPSFVITLAGLLGFLGLQLKILGERGTINIPFDSGLVKFASQWFLPPWLSYLLVVLVAGVYFVSQIWEARRREEAGLSSRSTTESGIRAGLLAALLFVIVFVLNGDSNEVRQRGVSYMVLCFLGLVVIVDLLIRRTRWGRSVMAVGGNEEAARRAGINVSRIYLTVFAACSTFAALGGILATARLMSANQSSGTGDTNLNAIAAAVIGGTSLFGGRGSAYSALLGILVIQSISNGLSLINLDSSFRFMVTGGVLMLAVIIDSLSRRSRAAAGRA